MAAEARFTTLMAQPVGMMSAASLQRSSPAYEHLLGAFMRERIFDPLGMRDTAFQVPAEKIAVWILFLQSCVDPVRTI